jgi:hypothetical protein
MASSSPRRVDLEGGLPVRLKTFLTVGKGRLMNLSASGGYVATAMILLPQAQIRLQIILRDEKRWVDADAIVAWENRGTVGRRDGLPPGYGLRFLELSGETKRAVEKLLTVESSTTEPIAQTTAVASKVQPAFSQDEPEGPPFRLQKATIDSKVPAGLPGVLVLSYDRTQEARVGRADEDLQKTLTSFEGQYAYFYFEVVEDIEDRFYRECELYHRLGGDHAQLDNTSHPEAPPTAGLDCPVCVVELP